MVETGPKHGPLRHGLLRMTTHTSWKDKLINQGLCGNLPPTSVHFQEKSLKLAHTQRHADLTDNKVPELWKSQRMVEDQELEVDQKQLTPTSYYMTTGFARPPPKWCKSATCKASRYK